MSARVLWDKICRALIDPLKIPTKLKRGKELRCHGRIANYDVHSNEKLSSQIQRSDWWLTEAGSVGVGMGNQS